MPKVDDASEQSSGPFEPESFFLEGDEGREDQTEEESSSSKESLLSALLPMGFFAEGPLGSPASDSANPSGPDATGSSAARENQPSQSPAAEKSSHSEDASTSSSGPSVFDSFSSAAAQLSPLEDDDAWALLQGSGVPAEKAEPLIENGVSLGYNRREAQKLTSRINAAREGLRTIRSCRESLAVEASRANRKRKRASRLRSKIQELEASPARARYQDLRPLPSATNVPATGVSSGEAPTGNFPSLSSTEDPPSQDLPQVPPTTDSIPDDSPRDGSTREDSTPEKSPQEDSGSKDPVPEVSHNGLDGKPVSGQEPGPDRKKPNGLEASSRVPETESNAWGTRSSSLVYGVLYSFAGLLFLAGDVVLSRELVSSAFRLSGTIAPWVFSGALAMVAILLKPAYSRLVESEYWAGRPSRFSGVILTLSVMAIVCLGVLGVYRYQTHSNQTELRYLEQQMETDQSADLSEIRSKISSLQQEIASSTYGLISFGLTAVFFALAGAVALGIGIRHLRGAYHRRFRPWLRSRRRRSTLLALRRKHNNVAEEAAQHREAALRLRSRLSSLPSPTELRDRISALETKKEKTMRTLQVTESAFLADLHDTACPASSAQDGSYSRSASEDGSYT